MKEKIKNISNILKTIFGYGILLSRFLGGLTFFGYLAALLVGGDPAAAICVFLYKTVLPIIIRLSTVTVLLGLVSMYMAGEQTLTSNKVKTKHN